MLREVSLALQGGGSMGAYSWGVLDALLGDERLEFEGVTGASAGAINAVLLADGLATGGRAAARETLRGFWEGFAEEAERRRFGLTGRLLSAARRVSTGSTTQAFHELLLQSVTDFQLDPVRMEPIRSVLEQNVDFDRLRRTAPLAVFVNATNVRTQELRVFETQEITADAVLASACIPLLFDTVEIDGEFYWDGSFLGNPAIFPVIYNCKTSDVLLIENRPVEQERPPSSPSELVSRLVVLGSRAALTRELRMIEFISELVQEGDSALADRGVREVRVHRIPPNPDLASIEEVGSFRADLAFFRELFQLGREAGLSWLSREFATN